MDISDSLAPRSDQLNADDLIARPLTVTIAKVTKGNAEQPFHFELAEYPGRPYKPGLSMRRVIAAAWGPDTNTYNGRKLTLYRDPDIKFGPDTVGGIRISHMSHLDKPKTIPLTVTRGKRKPFTVQPLIESDNPQPPADWQQRINNASTVAELTRLYNDDARNWYTPEVKEAFTARKEAIERDR